MYVISLLPRSWQSHLEIGKIIAKQFKVNKIFIGVVPAILFLVMLIKGKGNQMTNKPETKLQDLNEQPCLDEPLALAAE